MRRAWLSSVLLVAACAGNPAATGGAAADRLLVQFQPGTSDSVARSTFARSGLSPLGQADGDIWLVQGGASWKTLPSRFPAIVAIEPDVARRDEMVGGFWPRPSMDFGLLANAPAIADPGLPGLPGQWGLGTQGIDAQAAWNQGLQGAGVLVAVIDTGIDASQPDLQGQVSQAAKNFLEPGNPPDDDFGHGTHVAGIIAASGAPVTASDGHQVSVSGVAPRATLLPIRVLGTDTGDVFTEIQGIQYAVAQGAKVINLSLGSSEPSDIEQSVVENAISSGAVVVAAAGNDALSGNPAEYPASYPGVVSVTAIDVTHRRATFAEFNPLVTVAAPGVDVLSTVPVRLGTFAYASGTSMSAPMVSGMAALILSAHPTWTPAQVVAQLRTLTTPLSASPELGTVGLADAEMIQ